MTTASLGRRRPLRSIAAGVLLTSLLVAGLSACDPEEPPPSPPTSSVPGSTTPSPSSSPTPSATPSPTSEQDLEKAAIKQAVIDFKTTLNRVRKDPQADANQLKAVAGGELLSLELETMTEWRAKGWRQTGDVRVEGLEIESVSNTGATPTARVTYCANSSGVDALDAQGRSVVADGRPDYFPTVMWLDKGSDGTWLPVREVTEGDACDK